MCFINMEEGMICKRVSLWQRILFLFDFIQNFLYNKNSKIECVLVIKIVYNTINLAE